MWHDQGRWIRLIVGFQPLMVIPTASWIRWCMQVDVWWFNVDLSCLGWTIYAPTIFGCQATESIPLQVSRSEQKGITETIYADSELPSGMPNSLMPSAKLRSVNLLFLRLWWDAVGDRTAAYRTPSGHSISTMLCAGVVKVTWDRKKTIKCEMWNCINYLDTCIET